jgi:hypothetical protein
MIPITCINDSNRPKEIPVKKWLKLGQEYNVIFTCTAFSDAAHTKKTLAFQLSEIELTDEHLPFEYFRASRFAIKKEDLEKLKQLIKDCEDIDFSIEELMEQTQLETM